MDAVQMLIPRLRSLTLFLWQIPIALLFVRLEYMLVRDFGARRLDPAAPDRMVEYKLYGANIFGHWLLEPIVSVISIAMVNAAGGGIIHLRVDGWWYVPSCLNTISDSYGPFIRCITARRRCRRSREGGTTGWNPSCSPCSIRRCSESCSGYHPVFSYQQRSSVW